eukprot:TRINITY_DN2509_c0_g1_i3.p1 TRINITY_DN2509_c0_g1~~TRINITY_DN2509_c0_g1_i3.p1  ORF type:complete len:199 (-),score=2.75 TRINITY_DN2509_c0_g1_i3:76-672(-)
MPKLALVLCLWIMFVNAQSCGNNGEINTGLDHVDIRIYPSDNRNFSRFWSSDSDAYFPKSVCAPVQRIYPTFQSGQTVVSHGPCFALDSTAIQQAFNPRLRVSVNYATDDCSCSTAPIPTNQYVVGVTLTIKASLMNGFLVTTYNMHGCILQYTLRSTPLSFNETFLQDFILMSSAHTMFASSLTWGCLVIISTLLFL